MELTAIDPAGRGLEIRFVRMADRWAHTVALFADGRRLPLLASNEGGASDDWPPSPPLQELNEHEQNGTHMILGVGGAGAGHWSLSIEAAPAERRLTFDAACRLSAAPESLGSAYRTMLAGQRGKSLHEVQLPTEAGIVTLRGVPLAENAAADVEITPTGLAIAPAAAAFHGPTSARWRYVLELAAPLG